MNCELFIARRYLFSKKSHHAINIISGISVVGVAVATMALVCTLSVFNGFQELVADLFTAFDPQLRVTLCEGSTIPDDDEALQRLQESDVVDVCTRVLEGQALVVENGQQQVVTIKGVDDNVSEQAHLEDILYGDGSFCLHADALEYGVLGIQLASRLGLAASFPDPLQVYAPRKGERVNMANPISSFNHDELQSPGVVFMVKQVKYDAQYILTSLGFAQRLFEQQGRVSSVEIRLREGISTSRGKKIVKQLLGPRFQVADRYEQQEDVFRIMRIEKLISYLFLTFILLVASLGASDALIRRIFMFEGRLIALIGALIGIVLGTALCWAQQTFGLISMGTVEGSFIVEAYPVSVHLTDLLAILLTVLAVGWAAIWYPVRYLSRNLL